MKMRLSDNNLVDNRSVNAEHSQLFNRVIKQLTLNNPVDIVLTNVIQIIGEYLNADRSYIFQVHSQNDEQYVSLKYEWVKANIDVQINNQELQNIPFSKYLSILNELSEGKIAEGLVKDHKSLEFRTLMSSQGIKAYLFSPLIFKGELWGFIGFDDCQIERVWDNAELYLIQAFSLAISNKLLLDDIYGVLNNKEKQLEIAIESSNDGFWYINLEKNTMYFSKQWKRMLGYDDDELENNFETFEYLLHPEDRELVLTTLDPYTKINRGAFECEYRLKNKTGNYQWVLTQAYIKKDEFGNPIRFIGTNIDITARVNYKRHLKEKEVEYRNLVNSVHEIIFKTDASGEFTFLNPAWEQVTGFSVDKSVGTMSFNYIIPDEREFGRQKFFSSPIFRGESQVNFEVRFLTSQGSFVWIETFATVKYNDDGEVTGIYGTLIDIHQRKMAELAQKESEEKFRLMSETMSDLVSLHEPDGRYFYISPSITELLGYLPDSLIGMAPEEIIHPEDLSKIESLFQQAIALKDKNSAIGQIRKKTINGEYLWFESIVQPIKKGNRLESILMVSRDVSERKKAEMEMKKALEKEKELSELKSRFVTMASHEFRTPLTSIKSSVQLLEMYTEEVGTNISKPFLKHFGKIVSQIDRLSSLMNDILIVGRTEAKKMPFEPEKVDMIELCMDHIEQYYLNRADGRSVNFKVNGSRQEVWIDPGLMTHILSNILSNAFKYSPKKPNPELTLKYEEGGFFIKVQDFGIGIPKKEQEQLFNSFFRAENAVNIEGTGLGLVILKQFVEMHSGEIKLYSEEGEGTEVVVYIPYANEPSS